MNTALELKDIQLKNITPFMDCVAYAATRKEFTLEGVIPRFIEVLDYFNTAYPTREPWTQDETDAIAQYVTDNNIEAIAAFGGDRVLPYETRIFAPSSALTGRLLFATI